MSRTTFLKATLLALLAAMLVLASPDAARAATCGINGGSTAAPAVYDPFNPSGLASTSITLNLTRLNPAGGGKTDRVNFYLRSNNSNANGIQIIPRSAAVAGSVTGFNQNIFYNNPGPVPIIAPTTLDPISPNNFLKIEFTGNDLASDTAQVVFDVVFPANLNLNATTSLSFDAIFACSTTGGGSPTQQTGSINNAVTFPVTVLSALRTYYAGTALDFGEIGNITTASLTGTPQKTSAGNYVFVQSSGAYSVTLSSQNAFLLKKSGATVAADAIKYNLHFLGMDVNNTTTPAPNAIAITRSCVRATLSSVGNSLPIQASLQEGGQGKNPSPTYADVLTVTVTPLIYSDPGTNACASFGL
jgi:hypothetical protein